jgi:Fungal specific transcription factor domain
VFGVSSEHPFANYWTTAGGVPEVVGVLPSKEHADLLVTKYFEAIDAVYPMLNRQRFYAEYNRFWDLPLEGKQKADPSMLALHFAVYAMGAQFIQMESEQQKAQIAEFYVSAAHQSLRLYPFLSRTSLRSIQAMVLIKYFLMNDNKAADAWAFGGILIEQAYAMGLNRDPDAIVPHASPMEKHLRRKLWQAVYFQDTFLTVLVKLPPTTTFFDVTVDSLTEEPIDPALSGSLPTPADPPPPQSASMNPMSISSIAPQQTSPIAPALPSPFPPPSLSSRNDIAYIRSMWQLADLVQQTVCAPRALSRALTSSSKHKVQLLSSFRNLYASFPRNLTNTNRHEFRTLAAADPRLARQNLFLRSNYWHCVMLIEADENEPAGVKCDVRGALEAGSVAVEAFFDFWDNMRVDAGVWWVFQHRAFEEAVSPDSTLWSMSVND